LCSGTTALGGAKEAEKPKNRQERRDQRKRSKGSYQGTPTPPNIVKRGSDIKEFGMPGGQLFLAPISTAGYKMTGAYNVRRVVAAVDRGLC